MDSQINDTDNNDVEVNQEERPVEELLTHEELVKTTKRIIRNYTETDPIFNSLPPDVTSEEVKAQIAVAHGTAITVYVDRERLPKIPVIVNKDNTTVRDLKNAISRDTNAYLKRNNIKKKISWKYIWKVHNLEYDRNNLKDNVHIKDYSIKNNSVVFFKPKLRSKSKSYHDRKTLMFQRN